MKNYKPIYIMSSTLIIVAVILGIYFKSALQQVDSIKVTGSAKRDFISDIIVWESTFSTKNMVLKDAYSKLDKDRKAISKYLKKSKISLDDAIFSSISIKKKFDYKWDGDGIKYEEFSGYLLKQNLKIESNEVGKIENLSRDITTLIDLGIEIQSGVPYYFYSKLSDLKIDMIAEATKDANTRAERIANNAETKLGKLTNAQMGVFQIVAKNSTENYSWGGTHNKTSKHKTATVTMKLSYDIGL